MPTALVYAPDAPLDFPQYYMGGLVALKGEWEALYPEPRSNAMVNAGFSGGSTMHPRYAKLAEASGVGDGDRFISPPPVAIALAPVATLPFVWARLLWTVAMILFTWAAARASAQLIERLHGASTRLAGLFVVFVCVSPLVWRTLRLGQLTPVGAWCVAVTAAGLVSSSATRTGFGIAASSLSKQIGIFHVPLVAVLGRWRAIGLMLVGTACVLVMSLGVMGTGPFEAWFTCIVPSLMHSSGWGGNQSFSGLFLRLLQTEVLPSSLSLALRLAGFASLAGLTLLVWARRSVLHRDAGLVVAALGAFTVVGLVFSPIAWEHYHLYLLPLWAWGIATALHEPRLRVPTGLALLASWAPLCVFEEGRLLTFEPLQSHMLWGSLVLLAIAVVRIYRPRTLRS